MYLGNNNVECHNSAYYKNYKYREFRGAMYTLELLQTALLS
jgi:hypothetical protein